MKITSNRSFGVEIEIKGVTMEQVIAALAAKNVSCHFAGYTKEVMPTWKIVTDATVAPGFELVSPILSGDAGLETLRRVSEALVTCGAKVDKDCGFHVHVDARDLNGPTLAKIVSRYNKYESTIDSWMPRSRRSNHHCAGLNTVNSRLDKLPLKATAQGAVDRVAGQGRNLKVNLTAYQTHKTVEFRQHSGTVEARKMIPWVIFCVNFVETSVVKVVETEVAGLRKNAMVKKFVAMAELLSVPYRTHSNKALAEAMGVEENTVPAYVSLFRKEYGHYSIRTSRGYGYYGTSADNFAEIISKCKVHTSAVEQSEELFAGLPAEVISYFGERAHDLAG